MTSADEIGKAIDESAKDLEINLSEEDRQRIQDLMDKISGLDLNVSRVREQAKDIYDKLGGAEGILDKIVNFFKGIFNWFADFFSIYFHKIK